MNYRAYRCERILENHLPFQTIEDVTYKMAQSVADAFLGNIEYGKDYIIRTERINEAWSSYATRYTYSIKFDEIVRCKDCKHYRESEWVIATDVSHVCHFFADGVQVEPDGFCAWGERREE